MFNLRSTLGSWFNPQFNPFLEFISGRKNTISETRSITIAGDGVTETAFSRPNSSNQSKKNQDEVCFSKVQALEKAISNLQQSRKEFKTQGSPIHWSFCSAGGTGRKRELLWLIFRHKLDCLKGDFDIFYII